ncbi:MAG: nucleoside hydrolase [Planctomycetaceae bacterium]|nr:MAG: nucleoside hydrolase [Planctomycetaceae bacterium]
MSLQRILIDADPGIYDALGIALALFEPRLDVVGLTAVAGRVTASQATHNLWGILSTVDPPKWPRVGAADTPESTYEQTRLSERFGSAYKFLRDLHGEQGMGSWLSTEVRRHHERSAAKVLIDCAREYAGQLVVVTLGPLTNVALAGEMDPDFFCKLKKLVCFGGTWIGPGDLSPTSEFNVAVNIAAAQRVLHAPCPKTLVPLDIGRQLVLTYNHLRELPLPELSMRAHFFHTLISDGLRAHHQLCGQECLWLMEASAICYVAQPELFNTELQAVEIETEGVHTRGMTIFDRRPVREWRPNIHVVTEVDTAGALDHLLRTIWNALSNFGP